MKIDYSTTALDSAMLDSAIATLKTNDPILAALIDQVGSCTLSQTRGTEDLLFCLCESITHQQLSTKAAATIHRRFLALFDTVPTATELLNTPDDDLRGAGISRPKIAYMKDLAQRVLDGLPTLEELEQMDDDEIIKTLTAVKGIGCWTVQMLLIFRLHRWNVLPVDDLGIRSGIRKVYQMSELPDKKTVIQLAEKWQPYCTIASWYLWRSLETPSGN
jgi:DNA-3-methyladenine glycosylase II